MAYPSGAPAGRAGAVRHRGRSVCGVSGPRLVRMQRKRPQGCGALRPLFVPAAIYSRGTCRPTTIDVPMFHFQVRDGAGWGHWAVTTGLQPSALRWGAGCVPVGRVPSGMCVLCVSFGETGIRAAFCGVSKVRGHALSSVRHRGFVVARGLSDVSSARLSALLHVHLRPIDVVVFHAPIGRTHLGRDLALRCFQRLFLPHLATRPCP